MKKQFLFLLIFLVLPQWAWAATTWYVRPNSDGNGTDLNYGAEDGTSWANAFDGFAAITGVAAGDTVCLPGGNEPFMHGEEPFMTTNGTATALITYKGCGATPALIWGATELSGNRSYDTGPTIVNDASYAWVSDGNGLYHKPIGTKVRHLWEDNTWLQPVNIIAMNPAQIDAALQPGQFGNRSTGPTFHLYYRATSLSKSPTNTKIRSDYLPNVSVLVHADGNYNVFRNVELRGLAYFAAIIRGSHVLWEDVTVSRCGMGIAIRPLIAAMSDITLKNVKALNTEWVGLFVEGGRFGLMDLFVLGGEYSGTHSLRFNGDGFTAGDGDGMGFGQDGGIINNVVIENVTANNNYNYAIFVGTGFPFTLTNLTMTGISMTGNISGCFAEGTADNLRGRIILSGFLCNGNQGGTGGAPIAVSNSAPAVSRTFKICNGVFADNQSGSIMGFYSHANNNYLFCNLVFTHNFGDIDIQTIGTPVGNEVFQNVYFNSFPNQHKRFALVNGTNYYYDVGGDPAAFNAVTRSANNTYNIDPRFQSSTDFRPQASSPLHNAGLWWGNACKDIRGRVCNNPPNIGAYQEISGNPPPAPNSLQIR